MATKRIRTHPDVQYGVTYPLGRNKVEAGGLFDRFDEAVLATFQHALAHGSATLDAIVYSERGARWYGGEDAVRQYRSDPDASVFERFEMKLNVAGMVP